MADGDGRDRSKSSVIQNIDCEDHSCWACRPLANSIKWSCLQTKPGDLIIRHWTVCLCVLVLAGDNEIALLLSFSKDLYFTPSTKLQYHRQIPFPFGILLTLAKNWALWQQAVTGKLGLIHISSRMMMRRQFLSNCDGGSVMIWQRLQPTNHKLV